jgi:phosphoribosyl 1,2-cyclic phosphate phosphodiesterase
MKIRFWGTAAAEGVPCMFCGCPVCNEARQKKGRYARTRSQVLIENELLVDFNADTYTNALRYGFDASKLEHVLITHVHADHYYLDEFCNRGVNFAKDLPVDTLQVYGSKDVENVSGKLQYLTTQKRVCFTTLQPYETYQIAGIKVTPLPAEHGTDNPFVYILEKNGKTFFLFNDSGFLCDEAVAYLKEKQIQFDCISYDCTFGDADASFGGSYKAQHLGIPNILEARAIFAKNGNLKANTVEVLTHFSHNIPTIGYGTMKKTAKKYGFVLAYDGLEINI